jgi:hypothetical protein
MKWTLAWYALQENKWKQRALSAETLHKLGHRCYAEKQVIMWGRMNSVATAAWGPILKQL